MPGREWQPDADRALLARQARAGRPRRAPARHTRARARWGSPALIGIGSRPRRLAAIGQPVSVCHQLSTTGTPEPFGGPLVGVGVEPLAREEHGLQRGEVVVAHQPALGVVALDRPVGRGSGEHGLGAVGGDHAPERARVGGAHRLALVEHRGRAGEQRRVDDVGVADDPADVARGEPRVARLDAVDVAHRPAQRDGVATVVAHDALGAAGGPGGVEDVERVGGGDLDAVGGLGVSDQLGPVELLPVGVALADGGPGLVALQDDDRLGLVAAAVEGGVEQRLVLDHPGGLDPAAGRDDHGRLGVLDPGGQLGCGEAPEHDRVDRRRAGRRRAWRRRPRAPSACR